MKCSPGAIQHLISGAEGSRSPCLYHREWPNKSRGKQMYRSGVLKTTPTVPVSYPSNGIYLTGISQGFESEHNSFMSLAYIVRYSDHSCHPSCCLAAGKYESIKPAWARFHRAAVGLYGTRALVYDRLQFLNLPCMTIFIFMNEAEENVTFLRAK